MTKNVYTFLFVLLLIIAAIYSFRLLFFLLEKMLDFLSVNKNNIMLIIELRHIPEIDRITLINKVRLLGKAKIMPPEFEGDLMMEAEKITADKEKQSFARDRLLNMGTNIIPALMVLKNSKYLDSYTKKKITEFIEEIE